MKKHLFLTLDRLSKVAAVTVYFALSFAIIFLFGRGLVAIPYIAMKICSFLDGTLKTYGGASLGVFGRSVTAIFLAVAYLRMAFGFFPPIFQGLSIALLKLFRVETEDLKTHSGDHELP